MDAKLAAPDETSYLARSLPHGRNREGSAKKSFAQDVVAKIRIKLDNVRSGFMTTPHLTFFLV